MDACIAPLWELTALPLLTVLGRHICLWRGYLSYDVISEVSSARTETKAGWFGCVRSVFVVDMRKQLATGHVTLIITLSFIKNLSWERDLIQCWGQMTEKLGQFKMFSCVSWGKLWNCTKKPHANFVRRIQTCYKPYIH